MSLGNKTVCSHRLSLSDSDEVGCFLCGRRWYPPGADITARLEALYKRLATASPPSANPQLQQPRTAKSTAWEGPAVGALMTCIVCGRTSKLVSPATQLRVYDSPNTINNRGRWYTNAWLSVPDSTWYCCPGCCQGRMADAWERARGWLRGLRAAQP